ncbi:TonB family protein [Geobacter sulfurreducens]|uniref:TonB family protein n=1 Tax=Geobacter sulfurreducens TaxID=35554 RepID=UPI000022EBB3|nr:TonB family protein [Geobacter sulfurreducens]
MGSAMRFSAATPDHAPAEALRASAGERRILARAFLLSGVAHVAAAVCVMMPAGGGTRLPPANIIVVELGGSVLSAEKPVPALLPLPQPSPVRRPPLPLPVKPSPVRDSSPPVALSPPSGRTQPTAPAIAPLAADPAGAMAPSPSAMMVPVAPPQPVQAAVPQARGDGPQVTVPTVRSPEPPAASTGAADAGRIRVGYQSVLRGLIERCKEYPPLARRGRMEGTAVVRVVLARSGAVRRDEVARSSSHALLDNAALRAVRTVGRFPAVPPELGGEELTFEVPITFRLTEK